jgi:hypothetical protein
MRRLASARLLLLIEIAVPLVLFLAAEAGLRAYLQSSDDPPLPRLFQFPITTGKFLAYRRAESGEALDVLLLGLSQMQRASAARVEKAVAAAGHAPIRAFNFAAPQQWVELNRLLLRDVLAKIRLPRVIVYGIFPSSMLYERDAVHTQAIAAALPVFAAYSDGPGAALERALLFHSDLFLYREIVRDWLMRRPVKEIPAWVAIARRTNAHGDTPKFVPTRPVRNLTSWEKHDAKRFENFPRMIEQTPLFSNIVRFARLCRRLGIRLVVLNSPVHPLFLSMLPDGEDDYHRFVRRLRETAAESGAVFFDPADGALGKPEHFSDTIHANTNGAAWLNDQIGRFLVESGALDRP